MSREYRPLREITRDIRKNLKEEIPFCKFSVRKESGGSGILVSLMEAPFEATVNGADYIQLNHYYLDSDKRMSERTLWVMRKALEIVRRYHWDESDIQTDYHCCNFYISLHIGSYDKPFKVKKAKIK